MNKHQFFRHTECEYYPCHFAGQNCLFCFCPLYNHDCKGHFDKGRFSKNGLKDCSKCNLPHMIENYGTVIDRLKGEDTPWRMTYRPTKKRKKK